MLLPLQTGVSLQNLGSYKNVTWEQGGADPSIPMGESPKKKHTGKINFEVLLLMISSTKLFYSSNSYMLQAGTMQQTFDSYQILLIF